jgi:hypothetical protein
MRHALIIAMLSALFAYNPAFAQVGGIGSPVPSIGATSPLGIGPGSLVAPTGIPLGATELSTPGVSPMLGTSTIGGVTQCSGIGGSLPQSSFGSPSTLSGTGSSTAGTTSGLGSSMAGTSVGTGMSSAGVSGSTILFDGGGIAGTASGTCSTTGGSSLAGPAASASSPTMMGSAAAGGRVGIPMGSTELGAGGLSPSFTLPLPAAPSLSTVGTSLPCPTTAMSSTTGVSTTGMPTTTGMSTYSTSC